MVQLTLPLLMTCHHKELLTSDFKFKINTRMGEKAGAS